MSKFITALQTKDALTENGMATHSTSGAAVLDLFFKLGAARAKSEDEIALTFAKAFGEDALLATKAAFYNRDVREGQGERRSFRVMFRWLCERAPNVAAANIVNVPFYGRWDDLFAAVGTEVESVAFDVILSALSQGDQLCAKWMPREGKAGHEYADKLRRYAGLTWVEYRKLLASNTKVIEQLMCSKRWTMIDYNHVPSQAVHKYRKAFARNDAARYTAWVGELSKAPEVRAEGVKINAKAIHPHEILRPILGRTSSNGFQNCVGAEYINRYHLAKLPATELQQLEAQWAALPDYMPKGRKILPVVDVSGSMQGEPMDVAVALGLYLSERNVGPFQNAIVTFSRDPELVVVKSAGLPERVKEVLETQWGMNTDLEKVFTTILDRAVAANLAQEDLPETVLILSDMQFDQCISGATALEMIEQKFRAAGYTRPNVVFWNLRDSAGVPAKLDERGVALVSGYSPSTMKTVLDGTDLTPRGVMLKTLNSARYDRVAA